MKTSVIDDLIAVLTPEVVAHDAATCEAYRYDMAKEGDAGTPLAVIRPVNAEQVQTVMRWAHAHHIGVVPRGAGSGLSGGASAVDGTVTLCLERMRAIEIDVASTVAIVEPGAFNAEVKSAAAAHGLWYPPDPSSFEICSIGGNIATNAGGLCCVKYGVTTDYVLGLDVVLADGTLLRLGGKQIKDVAGLSLLRLFVGSEGVLGIVTRAILRLVPARAEPATMIATFDSLEAAADAVVGIRALLRPAMLELMDRASVNAVSDFLPNGASLDRDAAAVLIAQSDAAGAVCDDEIAAMLAVCDSSGAKGTTIAADAAQGESYAAARRAVFPALESRGKLLYGDVGVAIPLLPRLLNGIAEIGVRNGVDVSVCAHAGDGNTHPNVVFDPADRRAEAAAERAFTEIMDLAISLHGTITGEHGIGRVKKHSLPDQLGPDVMALTRTIKNALDPDGILNPGAML